MAINKQHILDQIKRTAVDNGGKALGRAKFETVTGIREVDWRGRFWARWGDAVAEAGLTPNVKNTAFDEQDMLRSVAAYSLELGRFPTVSEMQLKRRNAPTFPNPDTVLIRFGNKAGLAQRLIDFCEGQSEFVAVVEMCRPFVVEAIAPEAANDADEFVTGYVYLALMKVGREKRYKIGKANLVEQRARQVGVNLPEDLELIHAISTDDAYGIEAYWHKRFAEKRRGGEWFELVGDDVRAFKRRKAFM
jgi:hypothetical protein